MAGSTEATKVAVVRTVKQLEQARIAPLLREGVPRRRLRLEGRMGVEEALCAASVARKIGLSAEYAGQVLRRLADEGLLAWMENVKRYTVTDAGDQVLKSEFRRRGFTRGAVKTIVGKLSR